MLDDDGVYRGPERRAQPPGVPVVIDESWVKFLAKLGMGGIAAFLVYQMSVGVQQNVATTAVLMEAHVASAVKQEEQFDKLLRTLLNVTVQQCVNAANSETKRDACFQAIEQPPSRYSR